MGCFDIIWFEVSIWVFRTGVSDVRVDGRGCYNICNALGMKKKMKRASNCLDPQSISAFKIFYAFKNSDGIPQVGVEADY